MVPYLFRNSLILFIEDGKKSIRTLEPSRGGTGIRLKSPKVTLMATRKIINSRKLSVQEASTESGKNLNRREITIAIKKFDPGPAKLTQDSPCLPFKLYGFTGTGLAQPKIKGALVQISTNGSKMVPNKSMCFMGLRVKAT